MSVIRFDFTHDGMEESDSGYFIKYSEYERISTQLNDEKVYSKNQYEAAALEAEVKQLRAQLEARGSADEYGWIDGHPENKWFEEWFIAKLDNGKRVVLKRLYEGHSYDFTTADETYYKAWRIKQWMQFPDSEFLPLNSPTTPTPPSAEQPNIDAMVSRFLSWKLPERTRNRFGLSRTPDAIGTHMLDATEAKEMLEHVLGSAKKAPGNAICFVNRKDGNSGYMRTSQLNPPMYVEQPNSAAPNKIDYTITACYFPKAGEIEISYERNFDNREKCHLTLKVTPEQGESLVKVIDPCVYFTAGLAKPLRITEQDAREIGLSSLRYWIKTPNATVDMWLEDEYTQTSLAKLNEHREPDYKAMADGWLEAIEWLRNNYQDHPNIASLCDSMRGKAHEKL